MEIAYFNRAVQHFISPNETLPLESKLPTKLAAQRLFINEVMDELETELHANSALGDLENELAEAEVDAAISAKVDLFKTALLQEGNTDSFSEKTEVEHNKENLLDRLRSDVMVEINLSGILTLGRLNWISPNSSNLILTMDGQETQTVSSVHMFRRMLKNSQARFVEVAPLFERAVQSLLESADLLDSTHSS